MKLKVKFLALVGCMGLLAGCNALDGKCDYLPSDNCSCNVSAFDASYYNCNCKKYKANHRYINQISCASCSCANDTCSNCWFCGMHHNFHDQ